MAINWKDWAPCLEDDHLTLGEVIKTLPGVKNEDISFLVRLLENPESPISFKGAVTLDRHDAIHIVLGRGLLNQDEAFVIGFTMGTSKNITNLESFIFKKIASNLYPKAYRFNKRHGQVFDLALKAGKESNCHKIYDFPFEDHQNTSLKDLRRIIGVDVNFLKDYFRQEKRIFPHSNASKRLCVRTKKK